MAKENLFMKKAEGAPPPALQTPRPKRRTAKEKVEDDRIEKLCKEIGSGRLDDQLIRIAEALDQRREVMKEKLAAAVRAVYGEDYIVTRPGSAPTPAPTGNPFIDKAQQAAPDKHPNEVDLTGFAAEGLPQLAMGYGAPSIMDTGGAVSAAVDVMGVGESSSQIETTGAIIG